MFRMIPCERTYRPVRKLARAGEHSDVVTKELSKTTPSAARRRRFGTSSHGGASRESERADWSSAMSTRMLGRASTSPELTAIADEIALQRALIDRKILDEQTLETVLMGRIESGIRTMLDWTDGQAKFHIGPVKDRIVGGFDVRWILMEVLKSVDEEGR